MLFPLIGCTLKVALEIFEEGGSTHPETTLVGQGSLHLHPLICCITHPSFVYVARDTPSAPKVPAKYTVVLNGDELLQLHTQFLRGGSIYVGTVQYQSSEHIRPSALNRINQ